MYRITTWNWSINIEFLFENYLNNIFENYVILDLDVLTVIMNKLEEIHLIALLYVFFHVQN